MAAVFDYKSWIGRANDWQPKAMIAFHAVAVNTNLQENEGEKLFLDSFLYQLLEKSGQN